MGQHKPLKRSAEDFKRQYGRYPVGYEPPKPQYITAQGDTVDMELYNEALGVKSKEQELFYPLPSEYDKKLKTEEDTFMRQLIANYSDQDSLETPYGKFPKDLYFTSGLARRDSVKLGQALSGAELQKTKLEEEKKKLEEEKKKETGKALEDQYNLLMNDLREISEIRNDNYYPKKGMEAEFDKISARIDVVRSQMKKSTLPEYKPLEIDPKLKSIKENPFQ